MWNTKNSHHYNRLNAGQKKYTISKHFSDHSLRVLTIIGKRFSGKVTWLSSSPFRKCFPTPGQQKCSRCHRNYRSVYNNNSATGEKSIISFCDYHRAILLRFKKTIFNESPVSLLYRSKHGCPEIAEAVTWLHPIVFDNARASVKNDFILIHLRGKYK